MHCVQLVTFFVASRLVCIAAGPYVTSTTKIVIRTKPPQPFFRVLVDTYNNETWVLGTESTPDADQTKFTGNSGWTNWTTLRYQYANTTVQGRIGCCGSVSVSGAIVTTNFGLSSTNTSKLFYWGLNKLSGSLGINRQSPILATLASSQPPVVATLRNGLVQFGIAVGSGGNSDSVMHIPSVAGSNLWVVNATLTLSPEGSKKIQYSGDVYAVIDAGNPNISFEISASSGWEQLIRFVVEGANAPLNFTFGNFSHFVLPEAYRQGSISKTTFSSSVSIPGAKMVVRLGYPFLLKRFISLNVIRNSVVIASPPPTPPPPAPRSQWTTIVIVGVVAVFFAFGFLIGANHYCRLPPETAQQPTEEQPFLGGQAARLGQYSRIASEPPQSQPANAPSAASARDAAPSAPEPAPVAAPESDDQGGHALGGTATRDPVAMRNQRLAALERNMQRQEEDQE